MNLLKPYIQSLLFAAIGAGLLWLSFSQTNFDEIGQVLSKGNYWVVIPVSVVSVLVYTFRVWRWKLLYKGIGINTKGSHLFASLATGYLVNFAVPRLGEITRALVLKKSLKLQVNSSLSTIVFERITDILCLLIILIVAMLTELGNHQSAFYQLTAGKVWLSTNKLIILGLLILVAFPVYFWLRKQKDKISNWLNDFIASFFQLLRMPSKGRFFLYTLVIWVGLYLMTYLWFFIFPESATLTPYQAFIVMVLGTIARSLPIQAGSAGAYHYVVSQALLLMGIGLSTGNALAIVIHGFQTVVTLVLGFSSYLWLLYQNKNES